MSTFRPGMKLDLTYEESLELLAALRVHVDELERQLERNHSTDVCVTLRRSIENLASVIRRLEVAERSGVLYA